MELLNRMPEWFFHWAAGILLLVILLFGWYIIKVPKKMTELLSRETDVIKLQEELSSLKESNRLITNKKFQLKNSIENAKGIIDSTSKLVSSIGSVDPNEILYEADRCLNRIVEILANDVKQNAGETHRCGLWMEQNGELALYYGSTGFPEDYIGNRKLKLDHSLAGKAFIRKQTIMRDNVHEDEDWEPNPDSNNPYKALMCIPIPDWGVLTIDAINPMSDETKAIGELYARMIKAVLPVINISVSQREFLKEVATTQNDENPHDQEG